MDTFELEKVQFIIPPYTSVENLGMLRYAVRTRLSVSSVVRANTVVTANESVLTVGRWIMTVLVETVRYERKKDKYVRSKQQGRCHMHLLVECTRRSTRHLSSAPLPQLFRQHQRILVRHRKIL